MNSTCRRYLWRMNSLIAGVFLLFGSCVAQNGPTAPSVTFGWTQSVTPGVTSNCVYRSLVSGGPYANIFCSTAPITSYKDQTTAHGATYYYVVTARINQTEGAYSADLQAIEPVAPAAPTAPAATIITELRRPSSLTPAVQWAIVR